jgi:hypothetical protein
VYRGRRDTVTEYYVVNYDPAESVLALLDGPAKSILADQTKMMFFDNWNELEGLLKTGSRKWEFWHWLAALVVALLLLEVYLTRLFSRRRAAEVSRVSFGAG